MCYGRRNTRVTIGKMLVFLGFVVFVKGVLGGWSYVGRAHSFGARSQRYEP